MCHHAPFSQFQKSEKTARGNCLILSSCHMMGMPPLFLSLLSYTQEGHLRPCWAGSCHITSMCVNQPQDDTHSGVWMTGEMTIVILRLLGLATWIFLNVLHIAGKNKIQACVGCVKWGHLPFLILGFLPGLPEICFRCFRITLSGKSHRGIQLFFAQAPWPLVLLWAVYF